MTEDQLYPNQGEYYAPTEPEEQAQERRQETAEVYAAQPQIQKVIDHLDARIAARDSFKAIPVDVMIDAEKHLRLCAVNDAIADALREEKNLLEVLLQDIG